MSTDPDRTPDALTASQSAASKRGRRSRRVGHAAERQVCGFLRVNGYPDARTSRSALGSDGTRQAGDVIGGPVGWLIEVKNRSSSAWPTWLAKAALEAEGGNYVVVRRLPGTTDVSRWPCKYGHPTVRGEVCHGEFGAFLRLLERDSEGRA